MYHNLRAEMARHNLKIKDLAEGLGVRHATISDKLRGRSRFYYDEALAIRNAFFPGCTLEHLFENREVSEGAGTGRKRLNAV